MARKRKDQRYAVDPETEGQVFALLDEPAVNALVEKRKALREIIADLTEALGKTPAIPHLSQTVATGMGRKGSARFEVDPDGTLVLVVSYGGDTQNALTRTEIKPAWTRREPSSKDTPKEVPAKVVPLPAKTKAENPAPKKGFTKTSVSVTPPRVVADTDFDDLLDSFNEDAGKASDNVDEPETESTGEVFEAYVPKGRKLRRIPGQKVQRVERKGLAAILASEKNEGEPY